MICRCLHLYFKNVDAGDFYPKGITHVNIGTGEDVSIADLAIKIKRTVKYEGNITFDSSKPDGTIRKVLDVTRLINMGWQYKTSLDFGLEETYNWYKRQAK